MFFASNEDPSPPVLQALELPAAAPFRAYRISLEGLPLKLEARPWLRNTIADLILRTRKSSSLHLSVWLLLDELHKDNAIREISRNGRKWKPDIGIGVRPEGPPPRYRTSGDFLDRDYDSPIPTFVHTVIHLDADPPSLQHACEVMTGTGGLIQVLHLKPVSEVRSEWYRLIQPTIMEEGLAAYPLYFPLLSTKSFAVPATGILERWMSNVEIYIRESAEDQGILIFSKKPLCGDDN